MKGFSRLFRFALKTILLFNLLIDESVTNPVVSKDITGDYCHEHHALNSDGKQARLITINDHDHFLQS